MSLDSYNSSSLNPEVNIDEILSRYNIQQYYTENTGFDFKLFVKMALDFDEFEAEHIVTNLFKEMKDKKLMNKEDVFMNFSDEELSLIYMDILNSNIA